MEGSHLCTSLPPSSVPAFAAISNTPAVSSILGEEDEEEYDEAGDICPFISFPTLTHQLGNHRHSACGLVSSPGLMVFPVSITGLTSSPPDDPSAVAGQMLLLTIPSRRHPGELQVW
ncbi:hypothetical protein E1301_Tti011412 [Triplophysa tibetana]|uniref:Uncharacterized protein n=1 Tax=Triplophysa tibetana TaxID=1572043 RepID=A0A5A9PCS1_9TELE|nr:hypothetical protein E1301_Tti011412 [Triplophysa tibetana]